MPSGMMLVQFEDPLRAVLRWVLMRLLMRNDGALHAFILQKIISTQAGRSL